MRKRIVVALAAILACLACLSLCACGEKCNTKFGNVQFNRPDGWEVLNESNGQMFIRNNSASSRRTAILVYKVPVDFDERTMDDEQVMAALTSSVDEWMYETMKMDADQVYISDDLMEENGLRKVTGATVYAPFVATAYKGNMYVFYYQYDSEESVVDSSDFYALTHSIQKA